MSWRQNRLLMTLSFVLFAVAGAALVVVGDRAGQIIGLAALAMFGVGGLAWWIGEFRTDRAATPRLGRVRLPTGIESMALVLPIRTGKQKTAVIVMASIATGALILALSPEDLGRRDGPLVRIVMFVVAALLGVFVVRGLSGWRRSSYYLALTPTAVTSQVVAGSFTIPWQAITSVRSFAMHGQPMLGFNVSDESAIHNESILGGLDRLELPLTGNHRSVWLGGFSAPPEVVVNVVRGYLESAESRSTLGREPVPEALLRPTVGGPSGFTNEEKRHARSLARWLAAFLLAAYGVFVGAIVYRAIENLTVVEPARGTIGLAVGVVLAAALAAAALAHFGAAIAIVLKREAGRKVGIGLSIVGLAVGLLGLVLALATNVLTEQRVWSLIASVIVAYGLLYLVLRLVGDLSQLRAGFDEDSGAR